MKDALVKTYSDNVKAITDSIEKGNRITLDVKTDTTIDGDYSGNVALSVLEPGVNRIARPIRRIREISNVGTTTSKFVTYIQQTQNVTPGAEGTLWVNEAGAKFNGEVKYEEVSEEVKKIAAYIKVSKEMLADLSFVRSEINTELMEAIEQNIDFSLVNGNGGVDLNGLLSVAPAFSAGTFAGTIPGANISDLIRVAKAQIQAANFQPTHVVLNPEDVAKIELTKTSSGEYTYPAFWDANMMLAGLTIVSSNNITAGTLVVGDFTKFNIKFREDMNMSVGYENDDFTRNMVTILCEARLVAYIKGNDVNGNSHFKLLPTSTFKIMCESDVTKSPYTFLCAPVNPKTEALTNPVVLLNVASIMSSFAKFTFTIFEAFIDNEVVPLVIGVLNVINKLFCGV